MTQLRRSVVPVALRGGILPLLVTALALPVAPLYGQESSDLAATLARVRMVGHAIVAERARERRELTAELAPALAAIDALRAVLEAAPPDVAQGAHSHALATAASGVGEREEEIRAAVSSLRAERLALTARRGDNSPPWAAEPIDAALGSVRAEVLERIEQEVEAILDAPAATEEDRAARARSLRAVLDRLELADPSLDSVSQPTAVDRVPAGSIIDTEPQQ